MLKKIVLLFLLATNLYANEPRAVTTRCMPITLSLDESILLAARKNPNLQSQRLNYLLTKYDLYLANWQFMPHFGLQATAQAVRQSSNTPKVLQQQNFNLQPSMSVKNSLGTEFTLISSNMMTRHYNPGLSLRILQPLVRGFGKAVVLAAYNNANDSGFIARLNIEGGLRSTVTNVIEAYLDVVAATKSVAIDEDALKRALQSVEQTKLFIKSGRKAGNELVTVEANVASAQSQLENNRNALIQSRYALLTAIGIDPNTPVKIIDLDIESLIKKYPLPSLEETKTLVLRNDIQYQVDQITLHGSTFRNLILAEDGRRSRLDLEVNLSTGSGSGGGENALMNSLINGINQSQSIGLTLNIPIDDQPARQAVLAAKIAIKQAEISLQTEQWNLETRAINGWNLVQSAKRSLHFAEIAEKLQAKTYNISYQKYSHGLIDSLELQSAQVQLIQSQQSLLNAQINYLKALVNFDLLIGHTLKTWDLKVRLS